MARKGIHPLMRTMTVVLRNGSSYQLSTVLKRATPWKLQTVSRDGDSAGQPPDRGCCGRGVPWEAPPNPAMGRQPARRPATTPCYHASLPPLLQDTTSHPAWTGIDTGISVEDARMARMLERYSNLGSRQQAPGKAESQQ